LGVGAGLALVGVWSSAIVASWVALVDFALWSTVTYWAMACLSVGIWGDDEVFVACGTGMATFSVAVGTTGIAFNAFTVDVFETSIADETFVVVNALAGLAGGVAFLAAVFGEHEASVALAAHSLTVLIFRHVLMAFCALIVGSTSAISAGSVTFNWLTFEW
jgi:hypothetical protein